jgi:hypothetical protein
MDITIEQTARGRLVTAQQRCTSVAATFRYSSAEPLAVHVGFPPEASLEGDAVTWTFARDLLEEGLERPAGRGDVQLWPCGPGHTVVELHAPGGIAMLLFAAPLLRRFLQHTYAAVPAGQEDLQDAVDRGLEALFGGV